MASDFDWSPQPVAAAWVTARSIEVRSRLPFAEHVRHRLLTEAGVRFDDLIDGIFLDASDPRLAEARSAGWAPGPEASGFETFVNPTGIFPTISAGHEMPAGFLSVDLKVESLADFLSAWKLQVEIIGDAGSRWRWASIAEQPTAIFGIAQRLAWRGLCTEESVDLAVQAQVLEEFRHRQRQFEDDSAGFDAVDRLLDAAIAAIGRDVACQLFFIAEREYWMARNRAARAQYARQHRLGIGWANHDHHTYRSSRKYFSRLVGLWEKLGFFCRERFYAGREAGWGAQVMEQPITGIVTFNDLDLSSEELTGDFAHRPLAPTQSLGTVGLWCGLHGESLLQAGMHHLEAQFAFDAVRGQLAAEGLKMLKPFTDFPHLRQAFTEGERWPVAEKRIASLLSNHLITRDQADTFATQGAIGSHLENLERNAGFKGFNQTGVSQIIAATDPRKHVAPSGVET